MQFSMKNIFAFAAALALGVNSVVASPTKVLKSDRAHQVITKLDTFIDAGINVPSEYKRFDPSRVRPEAEIAIVTNSDEALSLSAQHAHQVRIEASGDELIYVKVPHDPKQAPTEHVGTLRGDLLADTLDKIESHLAQEQAKAQTGVTPVPEPDAALRAAQRCSVTWCFVTWTCIYYDSNCGGCLIFWCL